MAKKNQDKDTATAQVAETIEMEQVTSAAEGIPAVETATATGQTESEVSAPAEASATKTESAPKQTSQKTDAANAAKTESASAGKVKVSALERVGKAAIKRHGFAEVYVTSDGTAFRLHSDAVNHAANLANKEILKITK